VIDIVHNAGGKVIVQSGYLRNPDTIREDLDKIVAFGADGIEAYSASVKPELREVLINYAKEKKLLITGGSDGHGLWTTTYEICLPEVNTDDVVLGGITVYS